MKLAISDDVHIERCWCDDCVIEHWMVVHPDTGAETCYGRELAPIDTDQYYVKRAGRGFDLLRRYLAQQPHLDTWLEQYYEDRVNQDVDSLQSDNY